MEFPDNVVEDAVEVLSNSVLADAVEELQSDDATDLIQEIEDIDEVKSQQVISELDKNDRDEINTLRQYHEDQAGSIMQTEMFYAHQDETVREAISRLSELKNREGLNNVYQVFIKEKNDVYLGAIALENLITLTDFNKTFSQLINEEEYIEKKIVRDLESIEDVVKTFQRYDLGYAPVLNAKGELVGRITSDDIFDAIEDIATEQIYNLAGVDDDEEFGAATWDIIKKRAMWLFLNLLTAFSASFIIGLFDETLTKYIPLAILMPIVAHMGGNSGLQTLTVVVRGIALGEVIPKNASKVLRRELYIALINGAVFASIVGLISYLWFGDKILGLVIAIALYLNIFLAGFFGSVIPLVLKKMKTDPAFGSSVLLTTFADIFGFFVFLGLAKIILV